MLHLSTHQINLNHKIHTISFASNISTWHIFELRADWLWLEIRGDYECLFFVLNMYIFTLFFCIGADLFFMSWCCFFRPLYWILPPAISLNFAKFFSTSVFLIHWSEARFWKCVRRWWSVSTVFGQCAGWLEVFHLSFLIVPILQKSVCGHIL